jgi:hypothetical protein
MVNVAVEGDGTEHAAVFRIRNLSDRPVRVLGVTTSCACVSVDELPVDVPSRGERDRRVLIRIDGSLKGPVDQMVEYYTDHRSAPQLRGVLRVQGSGG